MNIRKILLTAIVSSLLTTSYSSILPVPGTFPTIQSALNTAQPFDTILVAPGTYIEQLFWPAVNSIRLISELWSVSTIIDAGGIGRCLHVNSSLIDTTTLIKGFTLTGGYYSSQSDQGAGTRIENGSVLMEDINITGNGVYRPGGIVQGAGIILLNSSSVFINCSIVNNRIDSAQWGYGAGIFILGGSPVFSNVIISGNQTRSSSWCYGVGIYAREIVNGRFEKTKVTENTSGNDAIWYYGNGIYLFDVNAVFENVLVAANESGTGGSFNYGGGIFCDGSNGQISLVNTTITDNKKLNSGNINGSGVYVRDAQLEVLNSILYNSNFQPEITYSTSAIVNINYSNVRGGFAGVSNINTIPGFISGSDFHLTPASPCAGAGTDQGAPAEDLDGVLRPLPVLTMPDMGCYETDQSLTSLVHTVISDENISIYPNPVMRGNEVTITNVTDTILITDISGRTILLEQNTGTVRLKTENLKAGLYLIRSAKSFPVKLVVTD